MGDMRLTPAQYKLFFDGNETHYSDGELIGGHRNALKSHLAPNWPAGEGAKGLLLYEFSTRNHFRQSQKKKVEEAVSNFNSHMEGCIKIRKARSPERSKNIVEVKNNNNNNLESNSTSTSYWRGGGHSSGW